MSYLFLFFSPHHIPQIEITCEFLIIPKIPKESRLKSEECYSEEEDKKRVEFLRSRKIEKDFQENNEKKNSRYLL